jgi:hypothetical protein
MLTPEEVKILIADLVIEQRDQMLRRAEAEIALDRLRKESKNEGTGVS